MKLLNSVSLSACALLLVPALMVSCERNSDDQVSNPLSTTEKAEVESAGSPLNNSTEVEVSKNSIDKSVVEKEPQLKLTSVDGEAPLNSSQPFMLKDLNDIKSEPGERGPKVGDMIYTFQNLPKGACGEYWVQNSDGSVGQVAVCDHAEGH